MNLLKLISKNNKKMKNDNMGCSIVYYSSYVIILLTIVLSKFFVIPLMAQMFLYTFITIYIGSHDSLKQLEQVDDRNKKADNITAYDAIMFPIIGSGALLTLYFAYKFLDPYYVNMLLTVYLTLAGVFSLQGVCANILEPALPKFFKKDEYVKTFKLPGFISKEPVIFNTNKGEIISFLFCFFIGARWIFYKDFITHNVLAVSFCFQAISLVILSNFLIGFLLLSGLFVYDIFWVFGNDVMVTVAKSFEAPVKLLFPVSKDPVHYSMLGLGDIIIPGIVISLCLRFDYYLHRNKIHKGNFKKMFNDISIHEAFKKYYFFTISVFYQIGLVVTYCMLFYFEHAQPALLYLVPACILAIVGCSLCKGEFKIMVKYQEITDKSNSSDDGKKKVADKDEMYKSQESIISNAKKRITNK
ncbi:signal peptide peptidase, putative [Plasmodium vivax]|uniref:Signal peptide peptidase domain containing protein n=6 Tax=Plasmodium vivax TaxID=5855 RepID=A5K3I6_PLAVS|nr:signal peptide peptidase domain containing protein [Plasmodium vivax]KMZ78788.1 signal peptide peptidase domain-containing protein [Plasmodium vivax India VII]KMZ85174.1 signal peptide peptidase domain-containing protein [Plasmodium vivax Brazil I]KMZ91634.1 signal peptide peptidase domain-containing protein [Plasmodium vivax Mauritania I]KMZ97846.1 signal peptide peptidase domain-containing protein [Plasmodium vivax North Korean]EDL46090.1 signal peptide peptidase domain containing protein|eukprot:XP_001615817.1 signal peptide peptidase domain containing protein [Plasmodium vivax Sal-1]